MSRKLEVRTRMVELQREYSALNAEFKEIEATESAAAARERYKDYQYKVLSYGYTVGDDEKIEEVTDANREDAATGSTGVTYCGQTNDGSFYVMVKEKEDLNRVRKLFRLIEAAERIKDKEEKDKAKYVKILLGEE